MTALGYMQMPAEFRYREVALKGKPSHETYDWFSLKHPKMDVEHRAKIFAPFDALRGFKDAIVLKEKENENVYTVLHRAGVGGTFGADGDGAEDAAC